MLSAAASSWAMPFTVCAMWLFMPWCSVSAVGLHIAHVQTACAYVQYDMLHDISCSQCSLLRAGVPVPTPFYLEMCQLMVQSCASLFSPRYQQMLHQLLPCSWPVAVQKTRAAALAWLSV
jgi:hypothetical protein